MNTLDSVICVSGGGSGLGAATARLFAEAGSRVAVLDINDASGEAVAAETGGIYIHADVADEQAVASAMARIKEQFGTLHCAVNCAGIGIAKRVLGKDGPHPLDSFGRVIRVNLIGTFNLIRHAAQLMSSNTPNEHGERGVIINTSSVAAFDGQIGQAAYAASKGGVASMTLPVARDLAQFGIRVVSIAPGIFDTPMLGQLSEPARASLGAQVPFPSRLGKPEEYASLARHIVENPMLNGEVIRLDGALRMAPR